MSDELYELERMFDQDEALPDDGFAYVLRDPDEGDGDYHCIGIHDSETEWISYNILVDDALRSQKDDINVMMADLGRRYD